MTADIAAAAAAAAAMRATVVAAVAIMEAAGVAARGSSAADDPVAGCDLDHRHGACCRPRPRAPPPALVRPLPAWTTASAWAEDSSFLGPTGSYPPEQAHFPGLLGQVIRLSSHTNEPHTGYGKPNYPVLYA